VFFPNEAEAIKKRGGMVIRLEGDPTGVRLRSKRDQNHISETALDNFMHFDVIVDNSKNDIESLRSKLLTIMNTFNICVPN